MPKPAGQRVNKVKTALIIRQPFFGVTLSMLNIKEDNKSCPTMATDAKSIFYNTEFVDGIKDKQLLGVFLHEILHVIYMHCDRNRVGGRDFKLFGVAADLVINAEILDEIKYELPEGGLYDPQFKGMTVEQVYELIKNDEKWQAIAGSGYGEGGSFDQHILSKADEERIKEIILTAYEAAKASKSQGNIPGNIERLVKEIRQAKVQWERLFHRYVGSMISRDDYSFTRPNRRHIGNDLYLPSLYNEIIGNVDFVVDTSGSMGSDDLAQIVGEVSKVSGLINEMRVISCDMQVHDVTPVYSMSDVVNKVQLRGGGGTDFRPAFEYVEKSDRKPELMIFATDTFGTYPEKKPPYPVVWISTVSEENASKPPFGHVIYMQ